MCSGRPEVSNEHPTGGAPAAAVQGGGGFKRMEILSFFVESQVYLTLRVSSFSLTKL